MIFNQKGRGFTLIELMIVLVIMATLAAVAYPSYQDSLRKARRADAIAVLMRVAHAQERHFTRFARYAVNLGGVVSPENLGMTSESLQSDGGFSSVTVNSASATTYTLTAAILPVDRECGDLTLDQYGQKGASGAQEVSFCW